MKHLYLIMLLLAGLLLASCNKTEEKVSAHTEVTEAELKTSFNKALRAHLDAVEQKDITGMQATMAPDGELFFLQPKRPLSITSSSFMDFHKEWFKDTSSWSITFKIIETRVGRSIGVAVAECLYEDPDRDGKPYYNKLHVTYTQKLVDGKWYVILDHATSFEKSTD